MAKARMVYASMSTDEQIASLSFKAQFLWPWLLPHCSDQGRLLANPLKIKLVVVPGVAEITTQDIDSILKEFAEKGLSILYEAAGRRILQVKNWWRYQKLSWAYPDELPPPDGWQDRLRYWHNKQIVTENWTFPEDEFSHAQATGIRRRPHFKGRSVGSILRLAILKRDGWVCRYCGNTIEKRLRRIDHIKPCSRGGEATAENLVVACHDCNAKKGSKLLDELGWTLLPIGRG